jgi:hypothetical protein
LGSSGLHRYPLELEPTAEAGERSPVGVEDGVGVPSEAVSPSPDEVELELVGVVVDVAAPSGVAGVG